MNPIASHALRSPSPAPGGDPHTSTPAVEVYHGCHRSSPGLPGSVSDVAPNAPKHEGGNLFHVLIWAGSGWTCALCPSARPRPPVHADTKAESAWGCGLPSQTHRPRSVGGLRMSVARHPEGMAPCTHRRGPDLCMVWVGEILQAGHSEGQAVHRAHLEPRQMVQTLAWSYRV